MKKCQTCFKMLIGQQRKHCSKRCKNIYAGQQRSKKPDTKICKECNKEYNPYTSLDKFCSANCRINHQKSLRSFNWPIEKANKRLGKNNPSYRNGDFVRGKKKSAINERIFIKASKELKQAMLDDYGYIFCGDCGESNSIKYETHHIIFRSEKPMHEHLHDKQNLIVLCIQCHNNWHKHKVIRSEIVFERQLDKIFGNDIVFYDVQSV